MNLTTNTDTDTDTDTPYIKFIFPNGDTVTKPIMSNIRGLTRNQHRPVGFNFINCTNDLITDKFIDWFFSIVLPALHTNAFIYKVCVSNSPEKFQQRLLHT